MRGWRKLLFASFVFLSCVILLYAGKISQEIFQGIAEVVGTAYLASNALTYTASRINGKKNE